jgi:predicted DNA-binding transcriptional regulator AlpA
MPITKASETSPAHTWERRLLTERDIAAVTGVSLATVRRWRLFRRGPQYVKLGSAVRYRTQDLDAWLENLATGAR